MHAFELQKDRKSAGSGGGGGGSSGGGSGSSSSSSSGRRSSDASAFTSTSAQELLRAETRGISDALLFGIIASTLQQEEDLSAMIMKHTNIMKYFKFICRKYFSSGNDGSHEEQLRQVLCLHMCVCIHVSYVLR